MDTKYFKDKVVIITGASSGIGLASARLFGSYGSKVVMAARSIGKLEELAPSVSADKDHVLCVKTDVSKEEDCRNLIEKAVEKFGKIDILVNNAGVTKDNLLMRMTEEEWDAVLDTNLKGAFLLTKAVARDMLRRRAGAIVNLSSVVGLAGQAGQCNYAASKGGLIAFTKSVAKEYAARGIRANAVAPGFIQSAMTDKLPEATRAQMLAMIPLKRMGTGEDIAKVVAFLVGDDSAYLTGQVLAVNGGMMM